MKEHKKKMNDVRRFRNYNSRLVALDIHTKNLEHKKVTDIDTFNKGVMWFESGLSLEDASDEMKNNFNFVNGYEKAKRMKNINENLEILGSEWFESGLSLDNAPTTYINNPYFMDGYNKANEKHNGKKI